MKFSDRYNFEEIPVVYGIKNTITNKWYIGSCLNFKDRMLRHRQNLSKNHHHSPKLQESWNLYGEDSFDIFILRRLDEKESVDSYIIENEYMNKFDSVNFGYNMIKATPLHGRFKLSEEAKLKAGKSRMRKVVCINRHTGTLYKIFDSLTEAANELGMETTNISNVCNLNSDARYLKDYVFRYLEDYNPNEDYKREHHSKGVPKSEEWKRKARLGNKKAKKVYKYDLDGNLICVYTSRLDAERNEGFKVEYLRRRIDTVINGYIYSHTQR